MSNTIMNIDIAAAEQRVMAHMMSTKVINGVPMMSHVQIAQLTGVRQDNVKRTMDKLRNEGYIRFTQIEETSHEGAGARPVKVYYVNERDSHVVVANVSSEYAAYLVDFWFANRDQKPVVKPLTREQQIASALLMSQEVIEEQKQKLIEQEYTIIEQQEVIEQVSEERDDLKEELGLNGEYRLARAISWLKDYFDTNNDGTWKSLGYHLTKLSNDLEYEIRTVPNKDYGKLNLYHIDVIEQFKIKLDADLNFMRKYRRYDRM